MEKKNMVLLTVIAVATLLVAVVGATFAYFTASIQDDRNDAGGQGNTNITTGQVANNTVVANIEGSAGSFTASAVYPGHKEVAAMSITTNGALGSKTGVSFKYAVETNTIGTAVKVSLYKNTTPVAIGTEGNYFNCTQNVVPVTGEDGQSTGEVRYNETCSVAETTLGTLVTSSTHNLKGGAEDLVIATDVLTTAVADTDETTYYYVVVEFEDTDVDQSAAMNSTLAGKVTVEAVPAA